MGFVVVLVLSCCGVWVCVWRCLLKCGFRMLFIYRSVCLVGSCQTLVSWSEVVLGLILCWFGFNCGID